MLGAVFSLPTQTEQQTLCRMFLAARVDWPRFPDEIPAACLTDELSFAHLVRSNPAASAAINHAYHSGKIYSQEEYLTRLWNCADGKIYSLGQFVLHFDLSELVAHIDEFASSATLSREVELPARLSPALPDLVKTAARRLHGAAILPSEVDQAEELVRRSEALNGLHGTMSHTRIAAKRMLEGAAGGSWNEADLSTVGKAIGKATEGLRKFRKYLISCHSEKQLDLSAISFGAVEDNSFSDSGGVLTGTFRFRRHVPIIGAALESVADGFSKINARLTYL